MPDPITPTDQTGPLDAGHTTTEFKVTRIVVWGGIIVAVLGQLAEALKMISATLGAVPSWLTVATSIVGAVAATAASIFYAITRGQVKVAAINASAGAAGTLDNAAKTLTGK